MRAPVFNKQGEKTENFVDLNPRIFEVKDIKPEVVHQVFTAAASSSRNVVASTKTRGEVRGGGKKPWQQKGTGRARAGSIRSPLWKGGGVTFGPRGTRNFSKKVNAKLKRQVLFSILSDRFTEGRIIVLDEFSLAAPKTKELLGRLTELSSKFENWGKKVLLITAGKDENLIRAAGNLRNIRINYASSFNIFDLLASDRLIILKDALPILEKTYLK